MTDAEKSAWKKAVEANYEGHPYFATEHWFNILKGRMADDRPLGPEEIELVRLYTKFRLEGS